MTLRHCDIVFNQHVRLEQLHAEKVWHTKFRFSSASHMELNFGHLEIKMRNRSSRFLFIYRLCFCGFSFPIHGYTTQIAERILHVSMESVRISVGCQDIRLQRLEIQNKDIWEHCCHSGGGGGVKAEIV